MTQSVASGRLRRRILRHHFPLLIASAGLIAAIDVLVQSEHAMFRLSMATAYAGLLLLGATLLIGPIRILRKRSPPICSNDLRRDIGIWCGLVSLLHVIFGLQVHLNSMLLYFVREVGPDKRLVLRTDPFGLANYTGLGATLVIALLLALSNDWSLRRLGARKWKRLQRWNYGGFALVVLHGLLYQVIENRQLPYPMIFGAMVLLVIAVQSAGFRQRRRSPPSASAPHD
jgi:sulfoxide reductase heme-binding subunit YedZ